MRSCTLALLACVAWAGLGRRLQPTTQVLTSQVQASAKNTAISSLRVLARLLLLGKQTSAFMPASGKLDFRADSHMDTERLATVRAAPRATAGTELPTVVVGGGIVGLTTAYYLTQKGLPVTIVEKCAIACHASGKAGGFLTDGDSGWHDKPAVAQLAKHSFELHRELADELGADKIGYRKVNCVGPLPRGEGTPIPIPVWLSDGFGKPMGNQDGLAQVTPYKFMDELKAKVTNQGADVIIAKATGVDMEDGTVSALKVERDGQQSSIPCSAVVLAMGPWASDAVGWFPDSILPNKTVSARYTSVIWDNTQVGKDALMVFVGGENQVEIYPRCNEAYANGCPNSMVPLPDDPLEINPPKEDIDAIVDEAASAAKRLKDAKILRTTACFLPVSDDMDPVIGRVPGTKNAVISCAGGCWGILNGPAMGQAAADLVAGAAPAVDLTPFDPMRLDLSEWTAQLQELGMPTRLALLMKRNPELFAAVKNDPENRHALGQGLLAAIEDGRLNA